MSYVEHVPQELGKLITVKASTRFVLNELRERRNMTTLLDKGSDSYLIAHLEAAFFSPKGEPAGTLDEDQLQMLERAGVEVHVDARKCVLELSYHQMGSSIKYTYSRGK